MDYLKLPLRTRFKMVRDLHDPCSCISEWRSMPGAMRHLMGGGSEHGNQPFSVGGFRAVWCEHADEVFRSIEYVDRLDSGMRHRGWYINSFQDEVARGVVLRLSSGRYAAGVADPYNFNDETMCGSCVVEIGDVYADRDDAIKFADQIAKAYADDAKEHDAKQQAEQRIEEHLESITRIRGEIINLIRAIKRSTLDALICERLRSDVRSMLAEKSQLFRSIKKLRDNYWAAVES